LIARALQAFWEGLMIMDFRLEKHRGGLSLIKESIGLNP
jgi:hypothetical protein